MKSQCLRICEPFLAHVLYGQQRNIFAPPCGWLVALLTSEQSLSFCGGLVYAIMLDWTYSHSNIVTLPRPKLPVSFYFSRPTFVIGVIRLVQGRIDHSYSTPNSVHPYFPYHHCQVVLTCSYLFIIWYRKLVLI